MEQGGVAVFSSTHTVSSTNYSLMQKETVSLSSGESYHLYQVIQLRTTDNWNACEYEPSWYDTCITYSSSKCLTWVYSWNLKKYMTNQKCGTLSNTLELTFKSRCYNSSSNEKIRDSSRLKWHNKQMYEP